MSGERCNGWLDRKLHLIGATIVATAAIVAAVILFAWRSQAAQDKAIMKNEKSIAVIGEKFNSINGKLDEIKGLLEREGGE